jgi:hypothetical protein
MTQTSSPCHKCHAWKVDPQCFDDPCYLLIGWRRSGRRAVIYSILAEIMAELERAEGLHAPGTTKAHYYAVIAEEFREYEAEVFREKSERLTDAQRIELVQVAAMCVRCIKDLS